MTTNEMIKLIDKLKSLIMHPIHFQDISVELLDARYVNHDSSWESPLHHHPWYEFNYVLDGELTTLLSGKEFLIKSGESSLIPPGCAHSHPNHGKTHEIGMCLRWKIHPISGQYNYYEAFSALMSTPRSFSFNANIDMLLQGNTFIKTQLCFMDWMINLCGLWDEKPEDFPVHENYISNQVIMYLQEYFRGPIGVQEIAASLNISYRNLSRNFKKETGITIIEKLNEIRIAEAKKLLISTNLPINKIALMVGFENEYYFSNTFRQYASYAPSKFRKDNKL